MLLLGFVFFASFHSSPTIVRLVHRFETKQNINPSRSSEREGSFIFSTEPLSGHSKSSPEPRESGERAGERVEGLKASERQRSDNGATSERRTTRQRLIYSLCLSLSLFSRKRKTKNRWSPLRKPRRRKLSIASTLLSVRTRERGIEEEREGERRRGEGERGVASPCFCVLRSLRAKRATKCAKCAKGYEEKKTHLPPSHLFLLLPLPQAAGSSTAAAALRARSRSPKSSRRRKRLPTHRR